MSEETVVTYELGVALLGKTRNAPHTNMITNASLIFLPPAFLVCRCDKLRSLHPSRHLSQDSRARGSPHSRPLVGEVDGRDIASCRAAVRSRM
jgi:hypothetical protein